MFCLTKQATTAFLKKLKDGEINPAKMVAMSSAERRSFFASFMGEHNAKEVNTLFEGKLLLKNQQRALVSWAKSVSGIKPEVRRDILSRVNNMKEALTPESERVFLEDLVERRLGVSVTMDEAGTIADLAKVVSERKEAMLQGADRMEYGRARVAFGNYVNDLKREANGYKLKDYMRDPVKALSDAAGTAKSLKASLDNSAIFRQGWKTMWTNPRLWLKNASKTFVDIKSELMGKRVLDEVQADIVSRPNAINGLYGKAKLAVGTIEEAYPTRSPGEIKGIGRIYRASESAYTGFVYRQRADIFDKYIEIARKTGVDLAEEGAVRGIGKVVNSLTGRAGLGRIEPIGNQINNVFFSPRFLKSHIDVLTVHAFDKKLGPFARKQAALNLLKVVSGTAAVLTVARAANPDSVELDPRSADFGKIKVGNTRFDVSGGMASVVTLASRLATMSTKSTTTGEVKQLNTGDFGAATAKEVVYNFFENKLSPAASVIRDLAEGQTASGEHVTPGREIVNLYVPMPVANFEELRTSPGAANLLLGMIADGLGISVNTYSSEDKKPTSFEPESLIGSVVLYARAIGTDPVTAFDRIFTGQRLRRIDNDTLIAERMPLQESQDVKQERGADDSMRLDHTIPLELGGSNSEGNLRLVPESEWAQYTPVENELARLLRAGKIDKGEAQDLIRRFKRGEIEAKEIMRRKEDDNDK